MKWDTLAWSNSLGILKDLNTIKVVRIFKDRSHPFLYFGCK